MHPWEQVRRALGALADGEVLRLIAQRTNANDLDPFVCRLEDQGLGIQSRGGHDGEYHQYASRHLPRPAPRTGPYENT